MNKLAKIITGEDNVGKDLFGAFIGVIDIAVLWILLYTMA